MKNGALLGGLLILGAVIFLLKKPDTVKAPAPSPKPLDKPPTGNYPVYVQRDLYDAFAQAEFDHDLPFGILQSMAMIESAMRPDVINCATLGPSSEQGIMQINPRWHTVDACDPFKAIDYAGAYLRDLYNQTGSWRLAVAAYNWGIGNLTRKGYAAAPAITRQYVDRVAREVGI